MKRTVAIAADQLRKQFGHKTDLSSQLSYSNGVQNILGMKNSNDSIRMRVSNPSTTDTYIVIAPTLEELGKVIERDLANGVGGLTMPFGLPEALAFNEPLLQEGGGATTAVTIATLDAQQDFVEIARDMEQNPYYFRAVAMKSYTTAGEPESTNFGNSIEHYRWDHLKGKLDKDTPIVLNDFEDRKDTTTSVMKVDFLAKKFKAFVSRRDFLVFKVNAGTKMDIDLTIGARKDDSENFFRMISNGVELLHANFPSEFSCNC